MHLSRVIGLSLITLALAAAISAANLPLLGRDFILFWTSGRAIQQGYSPYDLEFQARTQQANGWDIEHELMPFNPYSYPLWLAIAMWPLAWLPYETAFDLWLALNLVALALAIGVLLKVASRSVTKGSLPIAMLFGFTFAPVLNGLAVGQLNAALFAILAGMIWGLDTRRERLAGICMGLLATKPHIGLVIAAVVSAGLIARRRGRPLLWAGVTVAVCAIVSFVVSPTWVSDFLASFQRFTDLTGWTFPLNGFQDNPTAYALLRVSVESSLVMTGLLAVGLACLAILVVHKMRRDELPSMQWFSAAGCLAVFLIAPYARAYDLTFLLWPLIYFAFSDELVVPTRLRYSLGLLLYFTPVVLSLLAGQGISNLIAVYILAVALLVPPQAGVILKREA